MTASGEGDTPSCCARDIKPLFREKDRDSILSALTSSTTPTLPTMPTSSSALCGAGGDLWRVAATVRTS